MGKHDKVSKRELKRRKRKKQNSHIINHLFEVIAILLIIYASIHLYKWYQDSSNIDKEYNDISNITATQEVDDSNDVKIIESNESKTSPYWDYIKMKLINVDFSELEKLNSDVVGWIQVNGTNINYPFVQTNNNDYYLTHSFSKEYNEAGWVFLDYRNNVKSFNKNTIIYAHSRLDQAMFGSLKNLLKSNWYENKDNHIIKLSTKKQNTLWQVFSVYHIPTTSDYLKTNFTNDTDFENFANMLQKRSVYQFNTSVSKNDKILTLSTCYGKNDKMVMHAKLIKYSDK